MKNAFRKLAFALLAVALFAASTLPAFAAVHVNGYFRKDGTYVQPYYRSNPDGNPYNNYSYPGNVNPYTGTVASGDPATYLQDYYKNSASSPSYSLPTTSPSPTPTYTLQQETDAEIHQRLQLQIQALLAQIASLQAQIAALQKTAH